MGKSVECGLRSIWLKLGGNDGAEKSSGKQGTIAETPSCLMQLDPDLSSLISYEIWTVFKYSAKSLDIKVLFFIFPDFLHECQLLDLCSFPHTYSWTAQVNWASVLARMFSLSDLVKGCVPLECRETTVCSRPGSDQIFSTSGIPATVSIPQESVSLVSSRGEVSTHSESHGSQQGQSLLQSLRGGEKREKHATSRA